MRNMSFALTTAHVRGRLFQLQPMQCPHLRAVERDNLVHGNSAHTFSSSSRPAASRPQRNITPGFPGAGRFVVRCAARVPHRQFGAHSPHCLK